MIDLRQFRQFVAVAEELSFRRAALRLNMAQPPLTTAIKRIEDEVGTTLIERSNRITRLTEAGKVFLDEARRTISQADRTLTAARRAGAGLSGSLRVTFVPSVAHYLMPQILRTFRGAYPGIELALAEDTTARQTAALKEERADIGLVMPPLHQADGLKMEVIVRGQMMVVIPEGHRLERKRTILLEELAEEDWVLFPPRQGPGLYGRTLSACARAGFVPRVIQEALQMDTIISFVAGGIGLSLLPAPLAKLGRRGVVFRKPQGRGTPVDFELALAYREKTPALEAFAAIARTEAKAI